tara:strand:- start:483 stop:644 length:162 start_codon:yes stop_codon:yes gene_type:complete
MSSKEEKSFLVTISVEKEIEVLEEESQEKAIDHVRNNLNLYINDNDYVIEGGE